MAAIECILLAILILAVLKLCKWLDDLLSRYLETLRIEDELSRFGLQPWAPQPVPGPNLRHVLSFIRSHAYLIQMLVLLVLLVALLFWRLAQSG